VKEVVRKTADQPKAEKPTNTVPIPADLPPIGELPGIGGGRKAFGGLGGVHGRAGAFDLDETYLKRAQAELRKLNAIGEPGFEEEEKQ